MPITEVYISKGLFILALLAAVVAILYTYGLDLFKSTRSNKKRLDVKISKKEINQYFIDKGFIVCKITPVEHSSKWYVFLIKNGEYEVATVFTKGIVIEGHQFSIA